MNCHSVSTRLARTRPRPRNRPPTTTTTRGPVRSDSAPHRNEPIPSVTQASSATAEMSARLHAVDVWIGARNTPSEKSAPMATPTITMAAASNLQRGPGRSLVMPPMIVLKASGGKSRQTKGSACWPTPCVDEAGPLLLLRFGRLGRGVDLLVGLHVTLH